MTITLSTPNSAIVGWAHTVSFSGIEVNPSCNTCNITIMLWVDHLVGARLKIRQLTTRTRMFNRCSPEHACSVHDLQATLSVEPRPLRWCGWLCFGDKTNGTNLGSCHWLSRVGSCILYDVWPYIVTNTEPLINFASRWITTAHQLFSDSFFRRFGLGLRTVAGYSAVTP